jgi:nucleoside-diphosphate-sugar epimerase
MTAAPLALVTGSAGFVGRNISAELERRGYQVEHVDTREWCECCKPRDARHLFAWDVRTFDLVVHCAFHVGGRAAIDGEPRLLARNLELDAAMFDWAVRTGQGRVLYFSSSAAYPVRLQTLDLAHRLTEQDISSTGQVGLPDARYGWAKLTGERLAYAARESGLKVSVVRPFSGYGTDQTLDYPFPSFIDRAAHRRDPFVIWGSGDQVRDWIHIDDVVGGALAVVAAGYDEPVNLATGVGHSMRELAEVVCGLTGYEPEYKPLGDKPVGVMYRVGNPGTLNRFYQPTVTLAEGVERALERR